MRIKDILSLDAILIEDNITSRKSLLDYISKFLTPAHPELTAQDVFELFIERERLGSTSIGKGVALPHARVEYIDNIKAVFVYVNNDKIDFDAIDDEKIKMYFALIIPEGSSEDHLQTLSNIAGFFRNDENRRKISQAAQAYCESNDKLYLNKIFDLLVSEP